jgi:hypothetical protein
MKKTVQYCPSVDVDECLKFTVRNIRVFPDLPNMILRFRLDRRIIPEGQLDVPVSDLSVFSRLSVEVWSSSGVCVFESSFPLFNKKGVLVCGPHLFFLSDPISDIADLFHISSMMTSTTAPGAWNLNVPSVDEVLHTIPSHSSYVIVDFFSPFSDPSVPVLYSDHFKAVLGLAAAHRQSPILGYTKPEHGIRKFSTDSTGSPTNSGPVLSNWMVINGPIRAVGGPAERAGTGYVASSDLGSCISPGCPVQLIDYELFREHPATVKAMRINRTNSELIAFPQRRTATKPSPGQIARLNDILAQPIRALSQEERELIVKFLWSLTDKKHALLKVLIALGDVVGIEAESIDSILTSWAPVDIDGALALLGKEIGLNPVFAGPVREYAIGRLAAVASTSELNLYMFQLVQSLRYDNEGLGNFLIERCCRDESLATAFFWCLECESSDTTDGEENVAISHVRHQFWRELGRSDPGKIFRNRIEIQSQFRLRLLDISNALSRSLPTGMTKPDVLREAIKGNYSTVIADRSTSIIRRINLTNRLNFPEIGTDHVEIPIPVDPRLSLIRVDEKQSFCIRSAKTPFVVSCECFNKEMKKVEIKKYMFKTGDDLRQDQLVIQFITLIDGLLKSYGLDLKLSPYKVLATSVDDGFIEFVSESQTLSSVLNDNNNDLLQYFRSIRPKPDTPLGIDPVILDTFARSCAGYCAITYILGIGDRHMDNLLLTTDGRMFHVDFGYILGRDPKPFPPPMKLCREMVEGMGGTQSAYYKSFVSKCTQAFLILRRHSNLLISLLYLAADGNIKDMREQDPELAIMKVQKRLMPEVSDEVAEQHMINLINESTSALFPVVFEKFHKWAAYWRQ